MEKYEQPKSNKEVLDGLAMGFQNMAEKLQEKGGGEEIYSLSRELMVRMQRLRDSEDGNYELMKKFINDELSNIESLITEASSFSTESELEIIKNKINKLSVDLTYIGFKDSKE